MSDEVANGTTRHEEEDAAVLAAQIGKQLLERNQVLQAQLDALHEQLSNQTHARTEFEAEAIRLRESLLQSDKKSGYFAQRESDQFCLFVCGYICLSLSRLTSGTSTRPIVVGGSFVGGRTRGVEERFC